MHSCVPVAGRLHADLLAIAHAATSFPAARMSIHDAVKRRQLGVVYSDASAVGWGALHISPDAPMVVIPPEVGCAVEDLRAWTVGDLFSEHECKMSSGAREVRAIAAAIPALGLKNGDVAWHSDATVAVSSIAHWRSKADDVASILKELWDLVQSLDLRVTISHVLRDAELMPVADWLSRRGWRDRQAEWGFSPVDVTSVCHSLRSPRPTADLFASEANAVARPFCSRWAEVGAIGDAFFVDWAADPGRIWWAFPPISQLPRVCHRLLSYIHAAAQQASSSSSSSSATSQPRLRFSVVLVFPVLDENPIFLSEVLPHAAHVVTVYSPPRSVTAGVQPTPIRRAGFSGFRLMAGHRRARDPPPWPLRAALIHVRG